MDAQWAHPAENLRDLSKTFFLEMLMTSKSLKMPNHTKTWGCQTAAILGKIFGKWATMDTAQRWCISQMPRSNLPSGQWMGWRLWLLEGLGWIWSLNKTRRVKGDLGCFQNGTRSTLPSTHQPPGKKFIFVTLFSRVYFALCCCWLRLIPNEIC